MNPPSLRRRFAEFCQGPLYHRFLRTLNTTCRSRRRLLFWQEQTWRQFAIAAELPAVLAEGDYAVLAEWLHVCDVHDCDLLSESTPVVYGLICLPDAYLEAREAEFPFANPIVLGGCCDQGAAEAEVEYCPECRRCCNAWRQLHGDPLAAALAPA